jgi:hypothetical protein
MLNGQSPRWTLMSWVSVDGVMMERKSLTWVVVLIFLVALGFELRAVHLLGVPTT